MRLLALTTLSFRVDSRIKKRLEALARSTGRSRSSLAAEALKEYVSASEWQIAGVKRAIGSLSRGEGIPHEEVKAWLQRSRPDQIWQTSRPIKASPKGRQPKSRIAKP